MHSSNCLSTSHSRPANFAEPPTHAVLSSPHATFPPPLSLGQPESALPILVADDDPDDIFFIERLIRKTGVSNPVRTFDDGSEVVNFLGGLRRAGVVARHHCHWLLFLD